MNTLAELGNPTKEDLKGAGWSQVGFNDLKVGKYYIYDSGSLDKIQINQITEADVKAQRKLHFLPGAYKLATSYGYQPSDDSNWVHDDGTPIRILKPSDMGAFLAGETKFYIPKAAAGAGGSAGAAAAGGGGMEEQGGGRRRKVRKPTRKSKSTRKGKSRKGKKGSRRH